MLSVSLFYPLKRPSGVVVSLFPSRHHITDFGGVLHSGYRYLAWLEDQIDTPPKLDLNSHGPERDILYKKCKDWLEGKVVKPNLTGPDIIDKW